MCTIDLQVPWLSAFFNGFSWRFGNSHCAGLPNCIVWDTLTWRSTCPVPDPPILSPTVYSLLSAGDDHHLAVEPLPMWPNSAALVLLTCCLCVNLCVNQAAGQIVPPVVVDDGSTRLSDPAATTAEPPPPQGSREQRTVQSEDDYDRDDERPRIEVPNPLRSNRPPREDNDSIRRRDFSSGLRSAGSPRINTDDNPPGDDAQQAREERRLDLRFHIEWGGSNAEWRGEIAVDRGTLTSVEHIGLEPMAPAGWDVQKSAVRFHQATARTFDAIAVSVDAAEDAELHLTFEPIGGTKVIRKFPLRDVINKPKGIQLGSGRRLTVRRAPGDSIRLKMNAPSLIFEPNERVELSVVPNPADNNPEATHRCRLRLVNPRTSLQLWTSELNTTRSRQPASAEIGPFTVPMPRDEGVYELVISLDQRDRPNTFRGGDSNRTRRLQFVVLGKERKKTGGFFGSRGGSRNQAWEVVRTIDPSAAEVSSDRAPSAAANEQPTSGRFGSRVAVNQWVDGKALAALDPHGWLAFPLTVHEPGKPHRIELDFAGDRSQQLGLAILEPTADGQAIRTAFDSGIKVAPLSDESPKAISSATGVFWPRSTRAVLLVTNRSRRLPAVFGSIRIHAGPDSLVNADAAAEPAGRLLAAQLNAADLANFFGGSRVRDPQSDRFLTDWQTFWDGAERLAQLLQHRGYNAAVIQTVGDGGALYPSQLFPALTCYDNGVFFNNGQDLVRKDVLELLFRIFDRRGLRLIPSVRFSLPLHELESRLAAGEQGILLTDDKQQPWHKVHKEASTGPFYQPLDARVQRAMHDVVGEIVERYGAHKSFAGMSIDLNQGTYARFPDSEWGKDSLTLERFDSTPEHARGTWRGWRARELSFFYNRLHRELTKAKPGTRLFLAGSDLLDSLGPRADTSPDLVPVEQDVKDVLLAQGVDPKRLSQADGLVLLRPFTVKPPSSTTFDAHEAHAAQIEATFLLADTDEQAALIATRSSSRSFRSSDAAEFLGTTEGKIHLRPYIGQAGASGSAWLTDAVASQDVRAVFVSGFARLVEQLGGEQRVTQLFRSLPDSSFSPSTETKRVASAQPLTIRSLSKDGRTHVYVANASPWPLAATLKFQGSPRYEIVTYSTGEVNELSEDLAWRVVLPPHAMAACVLSNDKVRIAAVHTEPSNVVTRLATEIDHLERQVSSMRPWDILDNPGFEPTQTLRGLDGWQHSKGDDLRATVDSNRAASGHHSVHMKSEMPDGWSTGQVAWLRSESLPAPASGRVAFQAQVRIPDASHQPRVRLVVEAKVAGERFYRHTEYGNGTGLPPLSEEWQRIGILVDDLPRKDVQYVKVGIDLRGTGEVWIDDVKLFDVWLTEAEATAVSEELRLASISLSAGDLRSCRQSLHRAGPQYLRLHFDNVGMAERPFQQPIAISRPPTAVASQPKLPNDPETTTVDKSPAGQPRVLLATEVAQESAVVLTARPELFQLQPAHGDAPVFTQQPQRRLERLPAPASSLRQPPSPPAATDDRSTSEERDPMTTWVGKIYGSLRERDTTNEPAAAPLAVQLPVDSWPPTAQPATSLPEHQPRSLFDLFRRETNRSE